MNMKHFVAIFAFFSVCASLQAYEHRDYLVNEYQNNGGISLFTMGGDWMPYPSYTDRKGWDQLLGEDKAFVISKGEEYLKYEWKTVPASAYLAYERTGERGVMESPFQANRIALNALMMAELAEGKGRFIDQIVNGAWLTCQMPSWVLSAHLPRQATHRSLPDPRHQIIDLVSAGVGAEIAIAWHFFKDEFEKIDPSINYTLQTSVREKILDPFVIKEKRKGSWWIMENWKPGQLVNNWTPWCNSNVLICCLLMETDPQRYQQEIELSLHSVDQFINYVQSDGACEEGPSYWESAGAKLFDYVQLVHDATKGRLSLMDNKLLRAMGEYIVRSYIGNNWVVNFADATAKLKMNPALIYSFGSGTGSREMMDFSLHYLADRKSEQFISSKPVIWHDTFRSLQSIRSTAKMRRDADSLNTLSQKSSFSKVYNALIADIPQCTWYDRTQFLYLRNKSGWFVGAKGGHNNESHNHNDIGSFILYIDNTPVFVDAGVETYSKKTFSAERYTIWTMQSDYHNLPVINGTSQAPGEEFKAKDVSCDLKKLSFSADISGAYTPAAECNSWKRSYSLKEGSLEISDVYSLRKRILPDTVNFLVQGYVYLPGETCPDGSVVGKGSVVVVNSDVTVKLSFPHTLTPSFEEISITDPRLTAVWGNTLRRISLTTASDAATNGKYVYKVTRL